MVRVEGGHVRLHRIRCVSVGGLARGIRIADWLAWQVLIATESASLIHKAEKWLEGRFVPE